MKKISPKVFFKLPLSLKILAGLGALLALFSFSALLAAAIKGIGNPLEIVSAIVAFGDYLNPIIGGVVLIFVVRGFWQQQIVVKLAQEQSKTAIDTFIEMKAQTQAIQKDLETSRNALKSQQELNEDVLRVLSTPD